MSATLNPLPDIPSEIDYAAQSGELVIFVGAGISRLIKCPSWDGFADGILEQLVPAGIDHFLLEQIKSIKDPKKRLSIAKIVAEKNGLPINYESVLKGKPEPDNVYDYLNLFNSSFVTTNYEKYMFPVSRKADPEEEWRFYKRKQLLGSNLDRNGNVIHLHGCIDDPDNMVITTRDYLDHYSRDEVQKFLKYLFEKKTVLFLGYGLEEVEILEYILRRGEATGEPKQQRRRYMLQGFFKAEQGLCNLLSEYYLNSFATELIGFPKDEKGYDQQVIILAEWSRKLKFADLSLADEIGMLEEEIGG